MDKLSRFKTYFAAAEAHRTRGEHDAAYRAYVQAMEAVDPQVAPAAYATASLRGGAAAHRAGHVEDAQRLWSGIVALTGAPPSQRVDALGNLAVLAMDHEAPSVAREAVNAALEASSEHPAARARQWGNLGVLDLREGDLDDARRHFLRAADAFAEAEDIPGQAQVWNALGEVAMRRGDHEDAREYFADAFSTLVSVGAHRHAAIPRANQAHLLRRSGLIRDALACYQEVQAVLGAEGDAAAGAWLDVANALMDSGAWPDAWMALEGAEQAATRPDLLARVAYARADYWAALGHLGRTRDVAREALERFEAAGNLRGAVACWVSVARMSWALGEEPEPLPEAAYAEETPDAKIAVEAVLAERHLAAGELQAARALSGDFEDTLRHTVDRVRVLRARCFVGLVDLLLGDAAPEAVAERSATTSDELARGGAVRDAVFIAMQPATTLLLLGHTAHAAGLLERVQGAVDEGWPSGWLRSLNRAERLLAWRRGEPLPEPIEARPAEDIEARALEDATLAFVAEDGARIDEIADALEGRGRTLLAGLIRGARDR